VALDSILPTPVAPPPPKPATSSSSSASSASSSSGVDHKSDNAASTHRPSTHQSSSSSNSASKSDSDTTARNSGRNSSSRNSSSSSSQSQSAPSSSQTKQSNSSSQTQSANSTSNGNNGAAQSNKNPGPSFLQTLAQSQADAQDSTTATATASPEAVTGKGKGKGKASKDDSSSSSNSFGFLSQSLVAAMAGIQQPTAAQGATDSDESVDGVSLSSGTSAQSLVANLMQGTADELKSEGADDAKPVTDSTETAMSSSADPSASAAASFQAHLGATSQSQTSASHEVASTQINTPVGASGFADEVGDRITWMAHQGVQSASLKMTPEHMGPVEVRISMQDGSATVSINAAQADTRAALEQALPRLHEMFATQGLNLTDASVSQQFSRGQQQKPAISAVGSAGGVSDDSTSAVVSVTSARLGLVDTYA
jgi:flagellar hook-length control protein FliK